MTGRPAQAGQQASEALFDPHSTEFRRDPYPAYARLRTGDPVHRTAEGGWVLSRYEDCARALSGDEFCNAGPPAVSHARAALADTSPLALLAESMLYKDPPDHTRLRRLVTRPFAGRSVERLRPRIRSIVDELIARVAGSGRMDVIADVAYPLPVMVICDMLAIPPKDVDRFGEWSRDLAGVVDVVSSEHVLRQGAAAAGNLVDYFRDLIARRRADPGDDLLSELARAGDGEDGLTEPELLATCVQLLFAGHETTQNLIGNGMLALLRHPGQRRRLAGDPRLLPSAVEELLRFDAPGQLAGRWVSRDVEIGGRRLRAGERVTVLLGSANRDPDAFTDPDRLDVGRDEAAHLTFGHGPHFCLGGALARVEGQEAIGALVGRLPEMRLLEEPSWRPTYVLRGLQALRVGF